MKKIKMISMAMGVLLLTMCVPPEGSDKARGKDKAKLDSLRQFKGVDYYVVSYFSMSYNPHAKNVGYTKKKKK